MDIIVPFKIVFDDQDITTASDGSLDCSKAPKVISSYDLNAIEAATRIGAQASDAHLVAVSVGGTSIDDSKLKKSVLARGIDELFMVADEACNNLDANQTAHELNALIGQVGNYDLIVCGDGSADLYAQQVDVHLAELLGLPHVSGVVAATLTGDKLVVERQLATAIETLEVPLPAVVSISPDMVLPRICGMKDILAAGKKPSSVSATQGVSAPTVTVLDEKASRQPERRQEIFDSSVDGDIESFVSSVKTTFQKEVR